MVTALGYARDPSRLSDERWVSLIAHAVHATAIYRAGVRAPAWCESSKLHEPRVVRSSGRLSVELVWNELIADGRIAINPAGPFVSRASFAREHGAFALKSSR